VTRKRRYRSETSGRELLTHSIPPAPPPAELAGRRSVERLAGFELDVVRPVVRRTAPAAGALVYLPGGAFVNGIATQHWSLIAFLAEATGHEVYLPRYGLAPRHTADEAMRFLDAVLARLRPVGPLHLLGDSAGGNLALLLAQAYPGDPALAGLTLIAPWLDLAMGNPGVDAVEPTDPWLGRAGLRPIAAAWAGARDLRDPAVSPLFGRLDTLPPTQVYVGSRDITLPDCRLLAERAGPTLELVVEQGSPHVYPLLPTPEGRRARDAIVRHVQRTLG
jgi:acetyl esterase/lipase